MIHGPASDLRPLVSLHAVDAIFHALPGVRFGLEPLLAGVVIGVAWRRRGAMLHRVAHPQAGLTKTSIG